MLGEMENWAYNNGMGGIGMKVKKIERTIVDYIPYCPVCNTLMILDPWSPRFFCHECIKTHQLVEVRKSSLEYDEERVVVE